VRKWDKLVDRGDTAAEAFHARFQRARVDLAQTKDRQNCTHVVGWFIVRAG
jgi:hypothetical protein